MPSASRIFPDRFPVRFCYGIRIVSGRSALREHPEPEEVRGEHRYLDCCRARFNAEALVIVARKLRLSARRVAPLNFWCLLENLG